MTALGPKSGLTAAGPLQPAPSATGTFLALIASHGGLSRMATVLLVLQMTVTAVLEVATLGAFVPFFAAIVTDPAALPRLVGWTLTGPAAALGTGIVFLLLVFASILFRAATLRRINALSADMGTRLLQGRLDRLFATELAGLTARPLGEIMADATHRVNVIVSQIVQPALAVGANSLVLLAALLALAFIAPVVTLAVTLAAAALYAAVIRPLHRRIRADGEAANTLAGRLLTRVSDAVHAWVELLVYDRTGQLVGTIADEDRRYRDAIRRQSDKAILPRLMIEAAAMTGLVAVSLYIARDGVPERGVLVSTGAYLAILIRIVPLFQTVVQSVSTIQGALPALRSYAQDAAAPPPPRPPAPSTAITTVERIDLQGLGFRADGRRAILSDVTHRFERGRIHGIRGQTGSGKTTLLLLVMGLLAPTRGRILYDGAEVAGARRAAIRPALAYVGQRPILFRGTLRDNITLDADGAVDAALLDRALRVSTLDDDIAGGRLSLSDAIDPSFPVLSGGQQQRLNLARAVYQDRAVLILDEFTSALDPQTEERVLHRLVPYAATRIVIMVSHRPAPLKMCDSVLDLSGPAGGA